MARHNTPNNPERGPGVGEESRSPTERPGSRSAEVRREWRLYGLIVSLVLIYGGTIVFGLLVGLGALSSPRRDPTPAVLIVPIAADGRDADSVEGAALPAKYQPIAEAKDFDPGGAAGADIDSAPNTEGGPDLSADPPLGDARLLVKVTAYSYESCAIPSCLTRSGTRTRWGIVAVDPRVIPLGSQLTIEGFGDTVFLAEDTGGGVHGFHVDVWMPSTAEALRYGVQQRTISVLS